MTLALARGARGMTLVELLVGMGLALAGSAALTALLRTGVAAWERAGARAEVATEVGGAIDQCTRDLRVAGYDPQASGFAPFSVTAADRVEIAADLDGNGAIDPDSEERIAYRVATSSNSLQRVVGRQTLPILSDVGAAGFRLAYFDRSGTRLDPANAATAAATRVVTVEITTVASRGHPAVSMSGGARLVNR